MIERFQGDNGEKNIKTVLLTNPAVGQNNDIASFISSVSKVKEYSKDAVLFLQGTDGNSVFFILSGELDVVVNNETIATRFAPNQIGEMAAMNSSEVRSATILASSERVVVAEMKGEDFVNLAKENPGFQSRLYDEMARRQRQRLSATGKERTHGNVNTFAGIPWISTCVVIGLLMSMLVFFGLSNGSLPLIVEIIISILSGLMASVWFFLSHPVFFYRRLITLCVLSVVLKVSILGSVTINSIFGKLELSGGNDSIFLICVTFIIGLLVVAEIKTTNA